jgi:transglycosylase-like protein with SLT domain
MPGTGLPIPKSGDVLTQPISIMDADRYTSAADWGRIAAAGAKVAEAAGDVLEKYVHQNQVGYLADQDTEITRKRIELRDQHALNPEGFNAAWKGYTDGKLSEAAPWAVNHVRRSLGIAGNDAYSAILSERRARDQNLNAEKVATLVNVAANDLIGSATAGLLNTPEGAAKVEQYRNVLQTAVTSDLHSKEWADAHLDETISKAHGEEAARSGVRVYRELGYEAAVEHLRNTILENESLSLKPEQRHRAFRRGIESINLAKREDMQDRSGLVQESKDLVARIRSGQSYEGGEVRDMAGALARVGAAAAHRELIIADAVKGGTRGMNLPDLRGSALGRRDVAAALRDASDATGMPIDLLTRVVKIESGGDPTAVTGSYKGLFQLSDEEFKRYGGTNIFDAGENAKIGAQKLKEESTAFRNHFGRDPTPTEIFLMHNQGAGGAAAHTANPDKPAWQNMASTAEGRQKGEAWAKAAIWGNIPSNLKAQFGSVENVTSGQFTELWRQKLEGVTGDLSSLQAPYAGAVARGVTDELIKASRAAWPQIKSLIDRGQPLDDPDLEAIHTAASLSGDMKWLQDVESALGSQRFGKAISKLPEAHRQAAIDQLRAELAKSDYPSVTQDLIRTAVEKQFERQNKLVREDPVSYHIETGGSAPAPIDVGNSVSFRAALRQRGQIVQGVAADQGVPVGSALRDSELGSVRAVLSSNDPTVKARMFSDMQAALPEDVYKATLAKLGQNGPDAMLDAFIGGLFQKSPELAKSVMQGRDAIKTDKRFAEDDKDFRQEFDKLLPPATFSVQGISDPSGPYATMRSAVLARYADMSVKANDTSGKVNNSRLKQAVYDVTGGVLTFNGRTLIAPERGMTQDRLDSIIWNLTDADLPGVGSGSGKPISARDLYENGKLESIGEGLYLVQLGSDPLRPIYAMKWDVSGNAEPFILDLRDRPEGPAAPSAFFGTGKMQMLLRDLTGAGETIKGGLQGSFDFFINLPQDISNALVPPAEAAPKFKLRPGMRGFTPAGEAAWSPARVTIFDNLAKAGATTQQIVQETGMPVEIISERLRRRELAMAALYSDNALQALYRTRHGNTPFGPADLVKFTETLPKYDLDRVFHDISENNRDVYNIFANAVARQILKDNGPQGSKALEELHPEIFERLQEKMGKLKIPEFMSDNVRRPPPPSEDDKKMLKLLGIKPPIGAYNPKPRARGGSEPPPPEEPPEPPLPDFLRRRK